MTEKRFTRLKCHICGKEIRGSHYMTKDGYTCYLCAKKKSRERYSVVETVTGKVIADKNSEHLATKDLETICEWLNEYEKKCDSLKFELDTHRHPLWSTREAERKVKELIDNLADVIEKNTELYDEVNRLRIENMRLRELRKYER